MKSSTTSRFVYIPELGMDTDKNNYKLMKVPIVYFMYEYHNLDMTLLKLAATLNSRHFAKYNEYDKTKTPSLWAYFNTLPTWARANPIVRNVFMAMEYNRPNVSMRSKEVSLNYACSLILPIDKATEDVILIWANSRKLRLNQELGNELLMTPDSEFVCSDDEGSDDSDDEDEEGEGDREIVEEEEEEVVVKVD